MIQCLEKQRMLKFGLRPLASDFFFVSWSVKRFCGTVNWNSHRDFIRVHERRIINFLYAVSVQKQNRGFHEFMYQENKKWTQK